MITAFISHSSQQKKFVEALTNALGRTFCIVDEYDFEPAKKSRDEIFRNIRKADIFILLISQTALNSDWVKIEIEKARDRAEKGKIHIFPYIIDTTVQFTDTNIPEWITKEEVFNLKTFINFRALARDISEKQREIIYQLNPEVKARDELFVGRNNEIGVLETRLYTGKYELIKAIIVSGRRGIGRRKFLKKFTSIKLGYTNSALEIDLSRGDYIENFILQLNSYLLKYNLDDFSWDIWSRDKRVSVAVELLNEAYSSKQHVLIIDNGACVMPSGNLAEWFSDMISHPHLENFIGLFVASTITPRSHFEKGYDECICIELHSLNEIDRTNLFYAYSKQRGLADIEKEDVTFWVTKLHGSPEQIYIAVDSIKRDGRLIARKNIDTIVALGDKSIKDIVDYCNTKEFGVLKVIDIVVLLAELGSISDQFLSKIVGDLREPCFEIIEDLYRLSIVEFFGPSKEYIKLDGGVADFIDRAGYELSPRFSDAMEKISTEYLSESEPFHFAETEDLSDYMYRIQVSISSGKYDSKYFIPSIAIKSIIELYNKKKYDSVVTLCDGFLEEKTRLYHDARREINYWLCLALARKLDHTRFNLAVQEISGLDNIFLKGFMSRLSGDYPTAERLFRSILDKRPSYTKAAREMVTVLLKRRNYPAALTLAKDNYTANQTNPYHIEAYYRCLIHKNGLTYEDRKTLELLIKAMKTSYDENRVVIAKTMEAEYWYYVDRKITEPLERLQELCKKFSTLNYPQTALFELQSKSGIPVTISESSIPGN